MPRPASMWIPLTLRVPPEAEPVVRAALDRFYSETHRPLTEPVALGYMIEQLCADYLAGPACPHPGSAIRKELSALRKQIAARDDAGDPTKETT